MIESCRLERATGDHVYCYTHHTWDAHDPAELERIAAYVDNREAKEQPPDQPAEPVE